MGAARNRKLQRARERRFTLDGKRRERLNEVVVPASVFKKHAVHAVGQEMVYVQANGVHPQKVNIK